MQIKSLVGIMFRHLRVDVLVPEAQVPHLMWFFIYLMLASIAIYAWRHSEAPGTSLGWLKMVLAAAALGAILAGVESLVFGSKSGVVLVDVVAAAVGVLVACSGAVFAAAKGRLK
jgi:hypothetical protein